MSSHNTRNSKEGVNMRRVIESPDPNGNLLERILSRSNMQYAWKRVKANKGAAGIDKMDIDQFPKFAGTHWAGIRESLSYGSYQPSPVKRVEIPKQSGGTRPLGIPTVTDRLIQPRSKSGISDKLFHRFLRRYLIRSCQTLAMGLGRVGLPMMRSTKSGNTSKKAIGSLWTWICQSFLIRSTTMCSCTGWPGKSKTNVS